MITAEEARKLVQSVNIFKLHIDEIEAKIKSVSAEGGNALRYSFEYILPDSVIDKIIGMLKTNGYTIEKDITPSIKTIIITW